MPELSDNEFALLHSRFSEGDVFRELEVYGLRDLIEKGYVTYEFTNKLHCYRLTSKGNQALGDRDRHRRIKADRERKRRIFPFNLIP